MSADAAEAPASNNPAANAIEICFFIGDISTFLALVVKTRWTSVTFRYGTLSNAARRDATNLLRYIRRQDLALCAAKVFGR